MKGPTVGAAAALGALAMAGVFAAAGGLQPSAAEAELETLGQACALAMTQQVCRVEGSAAEPAAAGPPPPVFVAGVGAVDGRAYRTLRDSGPAMCERARRACTEDRQGALCVAARQLWGSGTL